VAGWLDFWSGAHSIYVNDRHLRAHYAKIAEDVRSLIGERRPALLDFGCGDALAAPAIAPATDRLLLYDGAPAVSARIAARFAGHPRIEVLDQRAWDALPPASLDMILVNSVLQYLDRGGFEALLPRLREVLRADGELVLADVIPRDATALDDIRALLRSAARHGYLLAALRGLAATFFSDYRRLRRELGLTCYDEAEMLALLRSHGFAAQRAPRNVGFSGHRMTFRARPAP
jgi:SAM-dependent methyltransferase